LGMLVGVLLCGKVVDCFEDPAGLHKMGNLICVFSRFQLVVHTLVRRSRAIDGVIVAEFAYLVEAPAFNAPISE